MDNIKLVPGLRSGSVSGDVDYYDNCGADELYYYDARSFEEEEGPDIATIRSVSRACDLPLNVMARVTRFEDIKKIIYAGAARVLIDMDRCSCPDAVAEASGRFGPDRIWLTMTETNYEKALIRARSAVEDEGFGGIVLAGDPRDQAYVQTADFLKMKVRVPIYIMWDQSDGPETAKLLKMAMSSGIILTGNEPFDCMTLKQYLKSEDLPVNTFESVLSFDEFQTDSDGLIPCITQDHKTGEVLMLAYMNRESFERTIASGKMCYYSRSRQQLWTKGETSGHVQYVKSLSIDCDSDTLLARVAQVGAACHTGNRSCFFRDLIRKEGDQVNPLLILEEVYTTILDRKEHPKKGSYTNYLFEQGIDKTLKKVGEEAAEIIIAAKNPDSEELKYEICDFLYHLMVLMAQQDVSWKDVTSELAARH